MKETEPDATRHVEKYRMEMVYIPAGEFEMGSVDADKDAYDDEKPRHTVYLSSYWIDKTVVTNAMFAKYVAETGYVTEAEIEGWGYVYNGEHSLKTKGADWQHPQGSGSSIDGLDDHPVVQVSWNDATAYCEWVGKRLPSEAEWEKAARGRDGRIYPWGNQVPSGERLKFIDLNPELYPSDESEDVVYQYTAPVGSYPLGASPYGVLDMAGNVSEWVNDWYEEEYYQQSPANNPMGPETGEFHVVRGGSLYSLVVDVRSAFRDYDIPGFRHDRIGFRCVLGAEF